MYVLISKFIIKEVRIMSIISTERDNESFVSHKNDHPIRQESEEVGKFKHLAAYMLIGLAVGLLMFLIIVKG